jgi:hypothetical protein
MQAKIHFKTFSKTTALMFSLFFMLSCSDKEDPIGKWDDIIKLSTKSAEFISKADSVTITTGGDWWWINGISFEDSSYCAFREDINLEADAYSIKEACFTVERRNKNTLFVKLNENNTGKERAMCITLEAGDYFDYVTIKQLAD